MRVAGDGQDELKKNGTQLMEDRDLRINCVPFLLTHVMCLLKALVGQHFTQPSPT